jgi:hypothetical protein
MAMSRYKHGAKETEFLIRHRGPWSAILIARAPRPLFLALHFGKTENHVLATISLEVRGQGSVHRLPPGDVEPVKGFPVIPNQINSP